MLVKGKKGGWKLLTCDNDLSEFMDAFKDGDVLDFFN